jgi:hypothetical protein
MLIDQEEVEESQEEEAQTDDPANPALRHGEERNA